MFNYKLWKIWIYSLWYHKLSKICRYLGVCINRSPEVWFDDVDPELLKANDASLSSSKTKTTDSKSDTISGNFVSEGAEEGWVTKPILNVETKFFFSFWDVYHGMHFKGEWEQLPTTAPLRCYMWEWFIALVVDAHSLTLPFNYQFKLLSILLF